MSKWSDYGEKFLELRSQGMSYQRIAGEVAVSVTTLKKWGVQWESKIQELRGARLAAFVDQQLVDLESRLRLRGEQILRMRDELAARDLSNLNDSVLMRIYLRYLDAVQKEVQPLKVEVSNPMAAYESILLRCLELPPGTTEADVPALAAEMAGQLPES